MGTRAQQIELLVDPLIDPTTGSLCAGYTAYFYSAGTSTAKNVWTEKEKTNPFTSYALDSAGKALLYGDGIYKIVVKNTDGATVLSVDNQKIQATTYTISQKSGTYTATPDDDVLLCTGTWTLAAQTVANFERPLTVKNYGTGVITFNPYSTQTVGGSSTYSIKAGETVVFIPNTSATTWLLWNVGASYSVKDFGAVADGDGLGDGTNNDTFIAAAVLAAYTTGATLYWPEGFYLSTVTIAYFHSVRHFGPGVIDRSGTLFYVEPRSSNTNTIYAAYNGNAAYDGLSSSQATTVQTALTALANYGPVLEGKWNVSLAAGTYTETNITLPIGLKSNYPIYIYGPAKDHPAVPTAIFDGDETSDFAFRVRNGSSVFFEDIKFLDFTGQGGIAATNDCLVATKNVHGTNCYDTILSYQGRLYVSGGVFELAVGNYSAIKSMFQNHHNIGYLYNRDTGLHASDGTGLGPSISSVSTRTARGLHVQENSTGHAAEMVIDNVTKGVEVVASSRVHIAASDFKNCGVAIEVEAGSNVYDAGTNTYNEGTADENDQTVKFLSGSVETSAFSDAFPLYITHRVFTPDTASCTGSTDEITAHTIASYLAGHEMQRYGTIRVRVVGAITGTNNTKSIRFRIGGHLGPVCVFIAATVGDFVADLVMVCSGADTQHNHGFGVADNGTSVGISDTTIDIDDGTAQDLTVSVVLANASDSVTVNYIEVMRGGG